MATFDEELEMTDSQFRLLRDFFRQHCGLHFGDDSRFLLEKRLARRIRDLDLASFASYLYLLHKDTAGSGELANAIDELTTNETYFFRERSQPAAMPLSGRSSPSSPERRRTQTGDERRQSTSGPPAAPAAKSPTAVVMLEPRRPVSSPAVDFRSLCLRHLPPRAQEGPSGSCTASRRSLSGVRIPRPREALLSRRRTGTIRSPTISSATSTSLHLNLLDRSSKWLYLARWTSSCVAT